VYRGSDWIYHDFHSRIIYGNIYHSFVGIFFHFNFSINQTFNHFQMQ
jgi:hypothetical protein